MMLNVLLVGLGGALGAISRYLLTLGLASWSQNFPYATLFVNVAGSFSIGVAFILIADRMEMMAEARLLIMVGFLGGFTTFSSFSLEIWQLFLRGELLAAVVYVLASIILCVLAVAAGIWVARLL